MPIQHSIYSIEPAENRGSITTTELLEAAADAVWRPQIYHQAFGGTDATEIIAEGGPQPGNNSGHGDAL
ncbi:hypothetical protein NKH90_33080, partial [Mesorhizobium sp. M0898]